MVKRIQYISMLCIGSLIAPMAEATNIKKVAQGSLSNAAAQTQSNNAAMGAIDQDLMNIVVQVMYGKTTGQVIDELAYTYGNGQSLASLSSIAQLLSEQLGYLTFAVTSAQAIVAILPPTSPHLVAAKLMINELSMFITCVQTILAQVQQNAQAPAPATALTSAVATPVAPASAAPAPSSDAALATAAVSLLGDVASAVVASNAAPSSNAHAGSQTTSNAPATGSNTHHHGNGW